MDPKQGDTHSTRMSLILVTHGLVMCGSKSPLRIKQREEGEVEGLGGWIAIHYNARLLFFGSPIELAWQIFWCVLLRDPKKVSGWLREIEERVKEGQVRER